jgi:hypothetical protein
MNVHALNCQGATRSNLRVFARTSGPGRRTRSFAFPAVHQISFGG